MWKKLRPFIVGCFCAVIFFTFACGHARPPKPGPNYVWVKAHTRPNGVKVPGHWQYAGPTVVKGKVWVPGHYGPKGRWIPGHWR